MADLVKIEVNFPNAKSIKSVSADRYSPYSLSRYKKKEVLFDTRLSYFTMYPEDMNIEDKESTQFIVKSSEFNRLDVIANYFYGDPTLYWVLGYFNSIIDPFDIPVGTVLKIPSKASLYKTGGVL